MGGSRRTAGELANVDVVEVYVPKRLAYLSELYGWLDDELNKRSGESLFRGFSVYEVSGAFRGRRKTYDEQTLVVRLVFDLPVDGPVSDLERLSRQARIMDIGSEVVRITRSREEEIWLIQSQARKYALPRGR